MQPPGTVLRRPLEEPLARVMFALSIAFLVLLAGILHRHQQFDIHLLELRIQLAGLTFLWPFFIAEAVWRLLQRDRSEPAWKPYGHFVLIGLVPPLRIGVRSPAPDRALWLPSLGWRVVDRDLYRRLERFFSVPMIVIALMVLPLLAIEYGWSEQVERSEGLQLFLAIGTAVIWFAFAIEFIVMVSVAPRKLAYCASHWVDLAIILLPLVQFLPLLRLLRVGRVLRLEQLSRMGRVYRLRGLSLRAWRAVLLLEAEPAPGPAGRQGRGAGRAAPRDRGHPEEGHPTEAGRDRPPSGMRAAMRPLAARHFSLDPPRVLRYKEGRRRGGRLTLSA
jgi:hypothetical protein